MSDSRQTAELQRTLGLTQALAIGMGTMVGAGIFVFPGLAGSEAGPAALLSFLLGGIVATLVALPTAELATAMPRSGGGYVFISRGLGTLPGAIVGIGLWWGLVFASGFYLVGFGLYVGDILRALGVDLPFAPKWLGVAVGTLLIVVNVLGTEKAGKLQNLVVGILLVILTGVLGWGMVDGATAGGAASPPDAFFPNGYGVVLTTTSLIFTSFLGFAQIANVSGEIKDPARNLPLSMLLSVGLVTVIYVAGIFVATSTFGPETLGELGETAMISVARELLGSAGGVVIMGAGFLATLSSANASLMSSSRSTYSLARDDLLPGVLGDINQRYQTPHVSLLATGVPAIALAAWGQVDLLAEVASFLHLLLYMLLCVAVIALRRREPEWYRPTFQAPLSPALPAVGALACACVVVFMQPASLIIGGGVAAVAVAWWAVWAQDVELKDRFDERTDKEEAAMTAIILLKLPDAPSPSRALLERLSNVRTILVGAYEISEQVSPEQARDEYADEAGDELERYEDLLEEMGQFAESKLVFTPSLDQTLDELGDEFEHDMLLVPGHLERLETVYVSVTSPEQLDRMEETLATVLDNEAEFQMHVMCPLDPDAEDSENEEWQDFATEVHGALDERFAAAEIQVEAGDIREPFTLPARVSDRDVLFTFVEELGLVERFFGEFQERIEEEFTGPIFFVR